MKKTYEKPVLTTEQFDVEDIITTSSLDSLDKVNTNRSGTPTTWEAYFPFGI